MKIVLLFSTLVAMTLAFAPIKMEQKTTTTRLNLERRDFCVTASLGLLGVMPAAANAKPAVRSVCLCPFTFSCSYKQNLNLYDPLI